MDLVSVLCGKLLIKNRRIVFLNIIDPLNYFFSQVCISKLHICLHIVEGMFSFTFVAFFKKGIHNISEALLYIL